MARGNGIEAISIRKIEAAIRKIKAGITPSDTQAKYFMQKLKNINEAMYEDLDVKLMAASRKFNEARY